MTSNGRRGPQYDHIVQRCALARPLSLTLCALGLAGTAGCMASPQYPIHTGEPAGDGALHMTQHPQYPIDSASAAPRARPAAPGQSAPPPPPPSDDAPRAMPRSAVDSNDLPPPSSKPPPSPQASAGPDMGLRLERAVMVVRSSLLASTLQSGVISDDGRPAFAAASTGFEQVALHHHRRHGAASKAASAEGDAHGDSKRSRRRRHGETATASRSGRHPRLRAPLEASEPDNVQAAEIETPYQTTVRPGERAADVAARLHVSKQALMSLNDIKRTGKLHPGEVLKTPYKLAYTVGQGDTLFAIAHRFGQDMDEVAKLNGLKHAAALHLGETIVLPLTAEDAGSRGHAQGPAPKPEAAPAKLVEAELSKARSVAERRAAKEQARQHVVREQAALASPTRRAPSEPAVAAGPPRSETSETTNDDDGKRMAAELNKRELASRAAQPTTPSASPGYSVANEMAGDRPAASPWSSPSTPYAAKTTAPYPTPSYPPYAPAARPGQVATLNAPTAPNYTPPGYSPPGYGGPVLGRVRPAAPASASGPASDADVSTAGRGLFVWPLRGAILSPFGDRGPGQRNDGLDISASPGESVHAAASGEVVYAGSSIPGFGNLVLVKHPGGWVTAYAHLDRIEVRMRDEVAQGEEIGQAGQTGAVDRPELHFEVRYAPDPAEKARPVDPALVLPGAG
jgi:murein DD-endopeptidase MepM/ murein hydrolase activator NlpD